MRTRTFRADQRFLLLPIADCHEWRLPAEKRQILTLFANGEQMEQFELALAENPRMWAELDLTRYAGQTVELRLEGGDERLIERIALSDGPREPLLRYREATRPLIHFTPKHGAMNDPNGLYWHGGVYHGFAQLNPYGFTPGNTHWLHAVSRNLVHWRQERCVLLPDSTGLMYSGGGVVDAHNTSGLQNGDEPPIFLFYTAAGSKTRLSKGKPFTIGAAYSLDGGQTYQKYAGNPVVGHMRFMNRDPKVLWVPEAGCWFMAVYLENDVYRLLTSDDLLRWSVAQDVRITHAAECPDLFRLPLDGDEAQSRWVLWGSPDNYIVGNFTGRRFVPQTDTVEGPAHRLYAADGVYARSPGGYAAQTFTGLPGGRVVQFSWIFTRPASGPFTGCFSVPNEVRLVTTKAGPRLSILPAKELDLLVKDCYSFIDGGLEELRNMPPQYLAETMDMTFRLTVTPGHVMALAVRGVLIVYDPATGRLLLPCGAYDIPAPDDGMLTLRVITDRCSVEIYTGDGLFNLALAVTPDPADRSVRAVDLDPSVGIDFTLRTFHDMWEKE